MLIATQMPPAVTQKYLQKLYQNQDARSRAHLFWNSVNKVALPEFTLKKELSGTTRNLFADFSTQLLTAERQWETMLLGLEKRLRLCDGKVEDGPLCLESLPGSRLIVRNADGEDPKVMQFGLLPSDMVLLTRNKKAATTWVSSQFTPIFRIPRQHAIGKTANELWPDQECGQIIHQHDLEIIKSGRANAYEESLYVDDLWLTRFAVRFPLYNHDGSFSEIGVIGSALSSITLARSYRR
jgi:hypothetical protein